MRVAAAAFALMLPVLTAAQDINPFKPPARGTDRAANGIFTPRAVPPSPLPLPPPPPVQDVVEEPVGSSRPAEGSKSLATESGLRTCPIAVTPGAPTIGAEGGDLVLRVKDGVRSRGCIAGIESRESWLKIRYFNGQDLALQVEPNTGPEPRRGELVFANATDSLVVRVEQAAR